MKVTQIAAPAAWASYLVNNDSSGIDAQEKSAADKWVLEQGLGMPSGADSESIETFNGVITVCLVYIFLHE